MGAPTSTEAGKVTLELPDGALRALRPDYYPGDVGFDPLNLKPTGADEFAEMATRSSPTASSSSPTSTRSASERAFARTDSSHQQSTTHTHTHTAPGAATFGFAHDLPSGIHYVV